MIKKAHYYLIYIAKLPVKSFRRLYDWTIRWSKSKKAPYALFGVSFCESSFFPIPPDVLLIPMVVANVKSWLKNAFICTAGSVFGAMFGYLIGWGLYETVGKPIVDFYHFQPQMDFIAKKFAESGFLYVFIAAFTPIPYKVVTISAGLFGLPLPMLILASILGRGGRFFGVAGLLRIFGKRIADTIEKYFDILSLLFVALLVGGIVAVKYLLK